MGGLSCLKEPLKTALKTPQPQEKIMENYKKYHIVSYVCDDEHYEIFLTDKGYNAILGYYSILDKMAMANEFSKPLTEEEFLEFLRENT